MTSNVKEEYRRMVPKVRLTSLLLVVLVPIPRGLTLYCPELIIGLTAVGITIICTDSSAVQKVEVLQLLHCCLIQSAFQSWVPSPKPVCFIYFNPYLTFFLSRSPFGLSVLVYCSTFYFFLLNVSYSFSKLLNYA